MQKLNKYKMKKLGIIAVYLFGSESERTKTVESDIDFKPILEYFDKVASKRYAS